ncbi:retrovirus-related pol polyprotein from transposon TNT 1-94 [Tanacetum coccineum]
MGHFARECKGPRNQENKTRNQESRNWNQDGSRKTVHIEDTSAKVMIVIDVAGFDWSFMADEEVPTNMDLMAFSDSEVNNNKSCSNSCLKNYETLKYQYDNLRIELNKSEFDLATYKRGLASVEEKLVFYKKNDVMLCDQIAVLKRDASFEDLDINALKQHIEKLKKEKRSNQIKIDNFKNASKSLDILIGSQITDKSRKGVRFESYNAVAPPPTGLFAPPTVDLSNSGLEDDEDESEVMEFDNVQQKPKQANQSRKVSKNPRNIRTNWNEKRTQKMAQKPVVNNVIKGTGQREVRPVRNNAMRVNHQNFSNSRRNFAPTAVLTKSGIVPISTARQSSSRAAVPVSTARPINTAAPKPFVNVTKPRPNVFQKSHSPSRRPFNQQTALKNRILNNKVNTAKVNFVYTAKGKRITSAVGEQGINDVKSSACWVWRPKRNVIDHISKNNRSYICKPFDYVDPTGKLNGCSRHMTRNKSYLTDYQDYDGGFVAFAGSSKGGKITGKGKIRTGKLDFKDVYFVKELKFNLFSVSQMCDRKNSVLFTETKCLILSSDFKLPDENQVMLKIPRKDNIFDNMTEFKTYEMNQFCGIKGIKREFSNARTPQQNGVAERKNRTLIEAARTMLADSLLPIPFWAEAVNTACYVQNRVLVTKPHNKTPYELLLCRTPIVSFMRPFGCPVTILNTLDHLGKFDGKADKGVLVSYSINNKDFRVYNHRTRIVEKNLHVNFLENKPNIAGNGPEWLFDIDSLTNTMNYQPVSAGNRTNGNAGIETNSDVGQAGKEKVPDQ